MSGEAVGYIQSLRGVDNQEKGVEIEEARTHFNGGSSVWALETNGFHSEAPGGEYEHDVPIVHSGMNRCDVNDLTSRCAILNSDDDLAKHEPALAENVDIVEEGTVEEASAIGRNGAAPPHLVARSVR